METRLVVLVGGSWDGETTTVPWDVERDRPALDVVQRYPRPPRYARPIALWERQAPLDGYLRVRKEDYWIADLRFYDEQNPDGVRFWFGTCGHRYTGIELLKCLQEGYRKRPD